MINIIDLLRENKEVSDWKINKLEKNSYEVYFVHDKLETVRSTSTTNTSVTVYVNHKKFTGDYTFTQEVNDSKEVLEEKIKNAIYNASLINNKAYKLVEGNKLDTKIESNFNDYKPSELASLIYNCLAKCTSKSKAQLNATEIFVYKNRREVINSKGLDKKEVYYDCMIETIPTYDLRGTNSVELYQCFNFNKYDENYIKNIIKQSLKDVTSRARAKKPEIEINCPVLLRDKEISEICQNISSELNYSALYANTNLYNKGQNIQENASGDLLTISLIGQVEGSTASHNFDNDGVDLTSQKLINKGIVKSFFGNNQYAQYVNKKVTGYLPIIELKKGNYSERQLKANPYLECVSFSGLQVDIANDYIGGEVRLANYFDGSKIHPLTGLSISAKFSDVLKTLKLSKKITVSGAYKGPNLALFDNFKIF